MMAGARKESRVIWPLRQPSRERIRFPRTMPVSEV